MRGILDLAGAIAFFFLFAAVGCATLFGLAVLVQPDTLPGNYAGTAWLALTVAAVAVPIVIARAALARLGRRRTK